jgi:photosystem II stability/assembly factor-like uncharacterized protein
VLAGRRSQSERGDEAVLANRSVITGAICALGLLLGASPALAAPVSVGHSGWLWGDPTPQGNTLNAVAFAGARGFAVGEFGTVLRSEDGGNSWAGLASGTENNLAQVQEVDPNTVIVGGGCAVRESVDAGASFHRLPVNDSESSCTTKIASFSFLNASTGFVEQADGTIFLTQDGGQTVAPKTPVPLNGASAGQILFVSPTVGFAIASGASGGRIYRTTDGAGSWTQVASSTAALSAITFVNATTAYAVGAGTTMLKSTNEGKSWSAVALALPGGAPAQSLTGISCSDVTHCLIATAAAGGSNTNVLVRTTDGGATGALVSPSQQNLLAVAFSTASNAVAVGQGGATALSSDGGTTFPTQISSRLGAVFSRIIRIGSAPTDAYAPGPGGDIAATTNGGTSWSLLRVPTSAELRDVAFPTPQVGYAANSDGTVFHTATGGLTWSILSSGGSAPSALLAPSATSVLLIGPKGVRRSSNGGASFAAVNATIVTGSQHGRPVKSKLASFNLSGGGQLAGRAVFAFGSDVLESTNGGGRWTLIPRPLPKRPVTATSFVSPTTGYESSSGRLFFTRNSGRSWKEILSLGSPAIGGAGGLSFSSASTGYVLAKFAGKELPLRTADGGRTWTPEVLPAAITALAAGGPVDYAAGGAGGLFQTTSGGLGANPSTLTLAISGARRLSVAKLRKAGGKVRLTGHLSPALGGEEVVISYLASGGSWHSKLATVTSSGTFALAISGIKASTSFVAQWSGNDLSSGAGTPAAQLTVTRR